MLKSYLSSHQASPEPPPRFASASEIELADQLRRQLEERYFGHAVTQSISSPRPDKDH